MGPFHSLFYILLGVVAWTLPWVTFHGLLARIVPDAYSEQGTPTAPAVLLAALVLSFALSLLAGFLTARLAQRRPLAHAFALGLVQLALGTAIQLQNWPAMPGYYHALFLALIVPGHMLGALKWGRR